MSEEELEVDEEGPVEESGAGLGGRVAVIVMALLGIAAGGAVGMTGLGPVVGPLLAERELHAGAQGGGHGGEGEDVSSIHLVDNLVVNPARSGGTRFLLTSIAIEVFDPEMTEEVASHDVELRDALILVLGARSTEELADISLRPDLINDMHVAIREIVGRGKIRRVYTPQFVIQ